MKFFAEFKKFHQAANSRFETSFSNILVFSLLNAGEISFFWTGTRARLILKDPELMKEVLANKQGHFQKPPLNPLILMLSKGLTTLEGEQWSKRRRMINPAFHLEKLKVPFWHF